MAPPPTPWPRLRDAWWVLVLAVVALVVFPLALVQELRCGLGRCTGTVAEQALSLDGLGSLPRLYTTGLFVAAAALDWVARRRSTGRSRHWWLGVAGICGVLAVAKLLSVHSTAEGISEVASLVGGVVLAGVALAALVRTGRRWGVASARAIAWALGSYAAAALGLDALTSALVDLRDGVGVLTRVAATFGEEFAEAVTALLVLVVLRWHLPGATRTGRHVPPAQYAPSPRRTAPNVRQRMSRSSSNDQFST